MAAKKEINSLSLQTRCPPDPMGQHGGFWFPGYIVEAMEAVALFEPRPSDVLLASFPKSGTTWLKALAFAAVHRAEHPPHSPDHPLRHRNPHQCVEFLELAFAELASEDGSTDVFAALPSPRVIGTHLPYSLLPEQITAEACRIVYICRDPKDTLVSMWMFAKKCMAVACGRAAGAAVGDTFTFMEAFELFYQGQCASGPPWHHVAGYWEASQRWPDKVLFLRYEELLQDPMGNVRKLAGFMGRAFSEDEEAEGVVQQIVELCSFHALKNMEVNKNGTVLDLKNESFRNGVAGDWTNHMTPAMAARLDKIVDDALQGSGFTFRP